MDRAKEKKNDIEVTTQEHIYGKKREIRVKCAME